MSKKPLYYLIKDDGQTESTSDSEIAEAAGKDGCTVVINVTTGEYIFDGDAEPILDADRDDWVEEEDEPEDEEDEE